MVTQQAGRDQRIKLGMLRLRATLAPGSGAKSAFSCAYEVAGAETFVLIARGPRLWNRAAAHLGACGLRSFARIAAFSRIVLLGSTLGFTLSLFDLALLLGAEVAGLLDFRASAR
jgi:hypothetical protein